MNDKRRSAIRNVIVLLGNVESKIDLIRDEEEDSLDNMPENLQFSDRYENMERAVDNLNEALELIDQVKDKLDDAITC